MTLKAVNHNEHRPEPSGRYRLLAEIGRGGMAKVFLAVVRGPSNFNKLVVVKALREDLQEDSSFLEMFLDEARLAARLNHPNVVQTYEVVEDAGRNLIVMEYLEGQPFSSIVARCQQGPEPCAFPLPMTLKILADTLVGLHHAHELTDFDGSSLGLVHRDVSPQNVFVTFEGQVKVLDFGIAKAAGTSAATQSGVLKGKVKYMAPEQMAGDPVDRRADIYAVGVMLWEALTGQPRWRGKGDVAIMNHVLNQEVQPPKTLNPAISDQLDMICVKALARDPKDRYQTAAELEMALEGEIHALGAAVKQRDLAKVVSGMFADLRAETKRLIEAQLSEAASHASSELTPIALPVGATSASSKSARSGRSSAEGEHSAPPDHIVEAAPVPEPKATRRPTLVAALALLVVGLVVFRSWTSRSPQPIDVAGSPNAPNAAGAPAAPIATSPLPAPTPPPAVVVFHFEASPPEARLFFDDEPLPSNPSTKTLPADGSLHMLRAEAKGYAPRVVPVAATTNETFELALERAKVPVDPRRRAPSPSPSAAPPAPAPAPVRPNCEQPYFIDDRGIKVFRPECMK